MPTEVGYLGLKLQTSREAFLAKWNSASKNVERKYARSDLIGTFMLLSYIGGLSPSNMRLVSSPICASARRISISKA